MIGEMIEHLIMWGLLGIIGGFGILIFLLLIHIFSESPEDWL